MATFEDRAIAARGVAEIEADRTVPRKRMPFRRWARELGWRYLVALLALFLALAPVVFVIASSFNTVDTLTTARVIPESLTLDNYRELFEGCAFDAGIPPWTCDSSTPFPTWLWNSIKIALIATTIQLVFSALAAYSFARLRWRGRRTSLIGILLIQMFPQFLAFVALFLLLDSLGNTFGEPIQINLLWVMLAMLFAASVALAVGYAGDYENRVKRTVLTYSGIMIGFILVWLVLAPLLDNWFFAFDYQVSVFPAIGLGTHTGLILVYLAGAVGVNTWLIKGFMDSIPYSLDEAAKVDGATDWYIFYRIILPLTMPILVVIFILTYIGLYNELILASVLIRDVEQFTYVTGLTLFVESEYAAKWGQISAAAVIGTIPIIVLFMALQDRIVSGLTGAVKG
jgi:ABC-type maltose transport system permease subunit